MRWARETMVDMGTFDLPPAPEGQENICTSFGWGVNLRSSLAVTPDGAPRVVFSALHSYFCGGDLVESFDPDTGQYEYKGVGDIYSVTAPFVHEQ